MSSATLLLELLTKQDQLGFEFVRDEVRQRITARHRKLARLPAPDVHTDFDKAFRNGTRFRGREVGAKVEVVNTTNIVLPSGRIVICDPSESQRGPLERSVTPGKYPVVLSVSSASTVVAAMIRLKRKKATRWERATWLDEQRRQHRVYGVESGTGCFVDLEVAGHLDSWDNIPKRGKASRRNPHAALWGHKVLDGSTGANVITFSTGGDGPVASYWGLDSSGAVVALVSDVNPLVEEQQVVLKIPRIFSLRKGEIRHQLLDDLGVIMEVIPGSSGQSVTVGFFGPKTPDARVYFDNKQGEPLPASEGAPTSGTLEKGRANLCFSYSEYTLPGHLAEEATLVAYLSGEAKQL